MPLNNSFVKTLQYKLGAIVLGVTVIALVLFGSLLSQNVEQTEYEEASNHLLEISHRIRDMLSVNNELMVVATERHFALFEGKFDAPFQLDTAAKLRLAGHEVGQLKTGKRTIGSDDPAIDEFTRNSLGHVATVFVRHGDDFLRVATSLRDAKGQRAVGTLLGRDHPAYRQLIGGQGYVGLAQLFGRSYMTKYRPLVSTTGRVIGVLFVGLDLSPSFARIREQIKAIRVGQTGYVYVLDSHPGESYGRLLLHPNHEGRNIFELAEVSAQGFFRQMLAGGDASVGRYQFRGGNGEVREKIAAFAEFPEWKWVIGAGAYYDEFTEQRRHLQYAIFGALLVAAAAIIFALKVSIQRFVLLPVLDMHEALRASETRFRSLVTSSNDLIYTTDGTGRLGAVFDKGLVVSSTAAEALVGQPLQALLGYSDPQHTKAHARALDNEHVVYDWSTEGPQGGVDIQSSLSPLVDANGRVSGLVCIGRDITERRRAETLTNHMAQHDGLTGLPNRSLMQDRLNQAILQAARTGKTVGVLFVDLDHFKTVNDQFGHEAGDQLLQAVAQRLLGCVRQADTVARIGGDEFVVVVINVSENAGLVEVAEKILGAFTEPFVLPSCTLNMSPSIGIGSYPADATDAAALLSVADAAMYQAKKAGRSNFSCAGPAISCEGPIAAQPPTNGTTILQSDPASPCLQIPQAGAA